MTKEDALKKIDELKSFVDTCDQKEVKKVKIQIKNRFTGEVIYESEKEATNALTELKALEKTAFSIKSRIFTGCLH
jgi:hypothetical protein